MKVLIVKPGKKPEVAEIESGLRSLQSAVGGFIEAMYPFDDPVAIICNEEGKIVGLPMNRALRDDDGEIYDVVCGDFIVVGLGEEDFTSLTDEQVEKYSKVYERPELFFRFGNKVYVSEQE